MNKDIIKGKWNEFKGEMKKRWSNLTDDDFKNAEGNVDSIVGRLQHHYGWNKERAQRELDEFRNDFDRRNREVA